LGGILTPTGVGTIVEENKEVMEVDGKKYIFERPIGADFALIYGTKVDRHGNVAFYGTTRNINTIMATAAETVIIQADELVDELDPNEVVIPGLFIDYIVVKEGNK
jgi:acetate CoA/acetoacetate CoA-transferase alpha subunit